MDPIRQARLNDIAKIAKRVEVETKVPARSTVAQWAVESKWGESPCGHANYFGIKRAARHSQFCIVMTHEDFTGAQIAEWNSRHPGSLARVQKVLGDGKWSVALPAEFADYPDLEASVRDYAWLVSSGAPYAAAWKRFLADGNVAEFVTGIARAYSTSPSYASLVTQIAEESAVASALEVA